MPPVVFFRFFCCFFWLAHQPIIAVAYQWYAEEWGVDKAADQDGGEHHTTTFVDAVAASDVVAFVLLGERFDDGVGRC